MKKSILLLFAILQVVAICALVIFLYLTVGRDIPITPTGPLIETPAITTRPSYENIDLSKSSHQFSFAGLDKSTLVLADFEGKTHRFNLSHNAVLLCLKNTVAYEGKELDSTTMYLDYSGMSAEDKANYLNDSLKFEDEYIIDVLQQLERDAPVEVLFEDSQQGLINLIKIYKGDWCKEL